MWLEENKADDRDLDTLGPTLLIIAVFIGYGVDGRFGGGAGCVAGTLSYLVSMFFLVRWYSRP